VLEEEDAEDDVEVLELDRPLFEVAFLLVDFPSLLAPPDLPALSECPDFTGVFFLVCPRDLLDSSELELLDSELLDRFFDFVFF